MTIARNFIVPCGTIFLSFLCFSSLAAAQESTVAPLTLVAMSTDDEGVKSRVQQGLAAMLYGWNEMARVHFRAAVEADSGCALAWCGLMLTEGVTEESRAALESILAQDVALTPSEGDLLASLLRLVQGDVNGAGEEFAVRAEQYRADYLSAAWAVRLLHDGYDILSATSCRPRPQQRRALELTERLYRQRELDLFDAERVFSPQDILVSYLRAWVEAPSPRPSDTALCAAQNASLLLPNEPGVQLLSGHLYFMRGQLKEALASLHRASEVTERARKNVPHGTFNEKEKQAAALVFWPLEIRAKLYESSLLWLDGQLKESLLIQRELLSCADAVEQDEFASEGAVLLQWEARSLPLRLLMLGSKVPSDAQIAAAVKAASVPGHEAVGELRECLRYCLVARQRAAAGKQNQALRCVQAAEACLKRLEGFRNVCAGQGGYVLSAWSRALEACQLAVLAAKAAVYNNTSDIWLQSMECAARPASLLMPPVLPMRRE